MVATLKGDRRSALSLITVCNNLSVFPRAINLGVNQALRNLLEGFSPLGCDVRQAEKQEQRHWKRNYPEVSDKWSRSRPRCTSHRTTSPSGGSCGCWTERCTTVHWESHPPAAQERTTWSTWMCVYRVHTFWELIWSFILLLHTDITWTSYFHIFIEPYLKGKCSMQERLSREQQ